MQQDRDDSEVRNPRTPYANWQELLRQDWGSDPTAVSRDYPRMRLHVATQDGPKSRVGDVKIGDDNASRLTIKQRNDELRECTLAISRLVEGPDSPVPDRVAEAWATHVDTSHHETASPDISGALDAMMKDLGWYIDRHDRRSQMDRPPTFNVLLCMAQGTAFYPSQRMSYLTFVPWAEHLRDVGWTVYVVDDDAVPAAGVPMWRSHAAGKRRSTSSFSKAEGADERDVPHDDDSLLGHDEGAGRLQRGDSTASTQPPRRSAADTTSYGTVSEQPPPPMLREGETVVPRPAGSGTVSVTHSFIVQNHVEKKVKDLTPHFQISWAFTITLKKATGEWVGVAMEQPSVFVTKPKNKLQRLRTVRLNDAIFNAFGVEVEEVETLPVA